MRYAILLLFLTCQAAVAGEPGAKVLFERWDAAYLDGARGGYVHTIVTQKPGEPVVGLVELRLKVKRANEVINLGMDTGSIESPEGLVSGVFMKQYLGKAQSLEINGKVDGAKLLLTLNNGKQLDPAPWNDRVIGVARQQRLFQEQKVQPGDQFSYLSFEPTINLVVNTKVDVKGYDDVQLFVGVPKQKLLRVEVKGDKIQAFQPPPLTIWLDANREQVRSDTDVPGLGRMSLVKTSKEGAMAGGAAVANAMENTRVIPLKAALPRAHEMTSALYRIRVKGDLNPASGFAGDGRQKPGNVNGDTFDMLVQRGIVGQADKVRPEYTESNYFITSDDAKVRELARKAVGTEEDAWKKAVRIEKYVALAMKPNTNSLLETADHVAKTLEGDCTEYAMLAAAMCRAEGIPSRTAIGLVYGEVNKRPAFVFHMWTEVWINGEWQAIDATLGRGGIGAAHIKVSDQSWHNESSMTPLLPTLNLLGRLSIETLRTE